MNYLRLCRDGLHKYVYNGDRKSECHIRKQKDGTYSIFERATGSLVADGFADKYEADDYFYEDTGTRGFIFCNLREAVDISPEVTVASLADFVQSDVYLSILSSLFPLLGNRYDNETAVRLSMSGRVVDGRLVLTPQIEEVEGPPFIDLSEEMFLYHNGTRYRGEFHWTVMDLLFALFGSTPEEKPRVRIGKHGIYNQLGESVDILEALGNFCDVDEDVTLLDIFRQVADDEVAKGFFSAYSWCHAIDAFHRAAEEIDQKDKFNYCAVYASMDMSMRSNEKDTKPFDFQVSFDFHVNGPVEEDERARNPDWYAGVENIDYGVSLTPVGHYAYLPLKLERDVKIQEYRTDLHKTTEVVRCSRDMRVLDVLDAIYWEISFHGSPEDAAAFRDDLMETVEKIKSGEIETVPMDLGEDIDETPEPKQYNSVDEMLKDICKDEDEDDEAGDDLSDTV